MKQHSEIPCWITLAHLPRWTAERVNRLTLSILHDHGMTLEEFFSLTPDDWQRCFALTAKEITDVTQAKKQLPNNSFLAEDLLSQGFQVITLSDPSYSQTLKKNLTIKRCPLLLYIKGNSRLLQEPAVAIVGSRNACRTSLQFTEAMAKKAVKNGRVVVSGFAKGVDRQALDSALDHDGKSIIVLPQGIMTFAAGINKYYRHIVKGDVLVLSTFHPKALWGAGLAMARNAIIYGLASEIYVAQSGSTGGTWEGALDGLRKGRIIYVRVPDRGEDSANHLLIQKGAAGVDMSGAPVYQQENPDKKEHAAEEQKLYKTQSIDDLILNVLKEKPLTAKQAVEKLNLEWTAQKMSRYLKALPPVTVVEKTKPLKFRIKSESGQQRLPFG